MILLDANVLLFAYDASSPFHSKARPWLEGVLSGTEPVGIPWPTVLAFLRITTNPRVLAHPFSIEEATRAVSSWLALPHVVLPGPGERHWQILAALLDHAQARGPLVSDAHLAALAVEHGATLATADRDFSRFDGLRTTNPIA